MALFRVDYPSLLSLCHSCAEVLNRYCSSPIDFCILNFPENLQCFKVSKTPCGLRVLRKLPNVAAVKIRDYLFSACTFHVENALNPAASELDLRSASTAIKER